MPSKNTNTHECEAMHTIPFIEHEYKLWKVLKQKNRIVLALCVTNIAWLILLAFIIFRI